jgi:hypothetical protein
MFVYFFFSLSSCPPSVMCIIHIHTHKTQPWCVHVFHITSKVLVCCKLQTTWPLNAVFWLCTLIAICEADHNVSLRLNPSNKLEIDLLSVIVIFLLIISMFYFSDIFVNVIAVKSSDISCKTVCILLQFMYLKIINDYKRKSTLLAVLQISYFLSRKSTAFKENSFWLTADHI